MRHGLILMGSSFAEQLEIARHADARGMHSVWCTEFFNHNGFVRMTAVAAATRRVKVGTAIAYAFMRTPLLAASAAMDVDELSEGRVILGLGSGTRGMNEKWYSVPFDKPPAPRMREVVQLVRAAFDAQKGGGLDFDGEFYRIHIPQYARPGAPRERIPIYIAGVNKHMIRVASEVADGLIGHPIYTRKYIAEKVKPVLDGTPCELAPYVVCSISDDVDQARREARAQIAFYYTTRLYHSVLDVHGWREIGEQISQAFRKGDFKAMSEAVPDELVDAIAITGRPDEARDRLKQWEGLTDHALLYPPTVGASPGRARENAAAIIETFATS
jgi:probable F420-dependent oxidoreductase